MVGSLPLTPPRNNTFRSIRLRLSFGIVPVVNGPNSTKLNARSSHERASAAALIALFCTAEIILVDASARRQIRRVRHAQAPPAMLAERRGRAADRRRRARRLCLTSCRAGGLRPVRGKPASDLLWRLADGDCLMGVQLGLMGVQLGGKVIRAGLRGCGCGAGTAGQPREAVTVLP
jgi:hypothetical protein